MVNFFFNVKIEISPMTQSTTASSHPRFTWSFNCNNIMLSTKFIFRIKFEFFEDLPNIYQVGVNI